MKKKVFAICGSTRSNSANLQIIHFVKKLSENDLEFEIYTDLDKLPHFNPDLDKDVAPPLVEEFRNKIKKADGVLICTPEYVFSLPGSLKNAIEWCVSTIIFSEKPVSIITASAHGAKAHESLQLVMKTIYSALSPDTQLLIQGAKGKVNNDAEVTDANTAKQLKDLMQAFIKQLNEMS